MPVGQTYRLKRHQWAQYRPTDPSSLESADQDTSILPENPGQGYTQRWRGRVWNQWPVYTRDVTSLQSTDQDVTIVPENPGQGYLQRYRGRPQWAQYTPTDPSGLELADQDVTLRPVPITTPYAIRKGRPQWAQYFPTDPSGLESTDQDVTLVPWEQTTAAYLRYRGKPQWAQYTPTDLTPFTPALPDQDVTFWPVLRRVWYPPSRAAHQQYFPTDPSGLELPDQDTTLVPWEQTTAAYMRYRGRPQQAQYTPTDYSSFSLPDQDVTFRPWQQTPATYLRWRGRVWDQWPVLGRDVNPLQSTDQPLIDLKALLPNAANYARWRGRVWNQWPIISRDINLVVTILTSLAGPPPPELQHTLNRLAGTLGSGGYLDAQLAANVWAGTVGLDLLGALNSLNGTTGLELNGVANALAGTTNLEAQWALATIATPGGAFTLSRPTLDEPATVTLAQGATTAPITRRRHRVLGAVVRHKGRVAVGVGAGGTGVAVLLKGILW
jgi:hypothetical protein